MRNFTILILVGVSAVLFYFTFESAMKVFRPDWEHPKALVQEPDQYRIVLITQELDTPFWDKVAKGASEQATGDKVSLEVWGSYDNNQEDFLKKIEIAIDSKVDGIIVQGLDTEEFKYLTKIKAASEGIPIITVANDVPMEESLRRTYVGSNQYVAGQVIARQLLVDLGQVGKVVLMYDSRQEYFQKQRLKGIQDILMYYPEIKIINGETTDSREDIIATTKNVMNRVPDIDAFVTVNANITGTMIQEISRRSQIEPYYIYSFDDDPESFTLLKEGILDGMIEQSPENMGQKSVSLMVDWLTNETIPLNINGYLTDIRMVKAMEE
ncbi:substrate-binding domain-containing protein [Bacillaceae bacterium S4-13-58]